MFRYRRRFPRAWLQSPRHYVPAGLSAQAFPVGVAVFRFTTIKFDIIKYSFILDEFCIMKLIQ